MNFMALSVSRMALVTGPLWHRPPAHEFIALFEIEAVVTGALPIIPDFAKPSSRWASIIAFVAVAAVAFVWAPILVIQWVRVQVCGCE